MIEKTIAKLLGMFDCPARERRKLGQGLTPKECEYLDQYIANKTQTATFSVYDGVVDGLIRKGILYKADTKTNKAGEQDFNMYPWAYDYFIKDARFSYWREEYDK